MASKLGLLEFSKIACFRHLTNISIAQDCLEFFVESTTQASESISFKCGSSTLEQYPKSKQSFQNGQKLPKWPKMAKNGLYWSKMAKDDQK